MTKLRQGLLIGSSTDRTGILFITICCTSRSCRSQTILMISQWKFCLFRFRTSAAFISIISMLFAGRIFMPGHNRKIMPQFRTIFLFFNISAIGTRIFFITICSTSCCNRLCQFIIMFGFCKWFPINRLQDSICSVIIKITSNLTILIFVTTSASINIKSLSAQSQFFI